jgi:RHS repeat-associated protein
VLADGQNSYLYDGEGRLCAVKSMGGEMTAYLYDAEGLRVAKGSITTLSCSLASNGFALTNQYLLDQGGDQVTELNGSGVWQHSNVWSGAHLDATYDAKGLHFHIADPLGTRRVQTNILGVVEETCQSLPFGDAQNCVIPTGAPSTAEDATEHHFTGKERDGTAMTESGNDYFQARYYNSSVGRFLSPDWSAKVEPIPYSKLDNPQSLNLYAYVMNNPLGAIDPDGHEQSEDAPGQANGGEQWWETNHPELYEHENLSSWVSSGSIGFGLTQDSKAAAQQQIHTETTVKVTAKPSVWKKIGGWFGDRAHAVSYAMTAFIITHSKLAMEGNKSGFEYWSKQSNEDIIKSLNPGGKEPMQIRMDGEDARIINGNMRLSILQSRGADLTNLKPEVLPSAMFGIEPVIEPTIEPEIIP